VVGASLEASGASGAEEEVKMGAFERSLEIFPCVFGARAKGPIACGKGPSLVGVDVVVSKADKLSGAEWVLARNGKRGSIVNLGE
jgi:hypothetical protein